MSGCGVEGDGTRYYKQLAANSCELWCIQGGRQADALYVRYHVRLSALHDGGAADLSEPMPASYPSIVFLKEY
jgi:hypothetical protein